MTKREREQVVELLRCAADIAASERWGMFGVGATAMLWLKPDPGIGKLATRAAFAVNPGTVSGVDADDYIAGCLEAAQRVEDGAWPE